MEPPIDASAISVFAAIRGCHTFRLIRASRGHVSTALATPEAILEAIGPVDEQLRIAAPRHAVSRHDVADHAVKLCAGATRCLHHRWKPSPAALPLVALERRRAARARLQAAIEVDRSEARLPIHAMPAMTCSSAQRRRPRIQARSSSTTFGLPSR